MSLFKLLARVTAFFMAISSSAVAGTIVAAKSDGVTIHKEASSKSDTLGKLKKDEQVEALDRKGMFWHVKTANGGEGYVSFLKVQRQEGDATALAKAIKNAAQDSRDSDDVKTARSRSAVMGVRGLDESAETAYAGSVSPNFRLVYMMEDRVVSDKKTQKLAELIQREIETRVDD